jgi:hypothetical protein
MKFLSIALESLLFLWACETIVCWLSFRRACRSGR